MPQEKWVPVSLWAGVNDLLDVYLDTHKPLLKPLKDMIVTDAVLEYIKARMSPAEIEAWRQSVLEHNARIAHRLYEKQTQISK